jgi:hypothetical protein
VLKDMLIQPLVALFASVRADVFHFGIFCTTLVFTQFYVKCTPFNIV